MTGVIPARTGEIASSQRQAMVNAEGGGETLARPQALAGDPGPGHPGGDAWLTEKPF